MGFFDRLLGKDPAAELERAERRLAGGDPVGALELTHRLTRDRDPVNRDRARALAQRARDALVTTTLDNAAAAEAAGDLGDAADWLQAALEQLPEGGQRGELETRRQRLLADAEATRVEALHAASEEEGPAPMELDDDAFYETLVGMLDERVAERWEGRPAEFRQALIAFNDGQAEEALETYERLEARSPGDPVLRFERGRCRLMVGRHRGAREDFEAVWPDFGDEPLDLAGSLTVPGLWAEAALGGGDPGAVLDRLREAAVPQAGNPDLTSLYARALLAEERWEEARRFLAAAVEWFPGRQDFPYELAGVLARLGEKELALRCLETAVAPSCASGQCARPPLHLPSLRALAALHLERGGGAGRAEELLVWIRHAQGGRLAAEDQRLLARCHRERGDEAAAAAAEAEAARLEKTAGRSAAEAAPGASPTAGAGEAVL